MEKAQEITFDYLRLRKQFGKPIGSFQALQHQAVNAYIRTEATRSLVFQVAANNEAHRIDPALAVATKAKASEDAMAVTEACIQLHGAIGFTDEHDIGLYLKRAMLLSSLSRQRSGAATPLCENSRPDAIDLRSPRVQFIAKLPIAARTALPVRIRRSS